MASSRQRGPTTGNRPGRVLPVLALVAATALVLVGAGLGDSPRQRSLSSLSSEQVTRSMTCSAGLPGGEAVSGSLEGSVSTSRPSKSGVSKIATAGAPMVVRAAHASAPGAYASQSAATPNWYAAQPCPAPAAQQWFVGAGGSQLHSSVLTLTNSRSGQALVDVVVWGPQGEVQAPGLRGVSVGRTPVTLDLAEVSPGVGDLAFSVTSVQGLVSANLVDTRFATAVAKPVTEFVPAQPEPGTDVVLGGLGGPGTKASKSRRSLLLLNTSETSAVVGLEFIGKRGTFESTKLATVSAPPGQVLTVPLPAADFEDVLGVRLTSPEPVVAGLRSEVGQDLVHASTLHDLGDRAVLGVPRNTTGVVRLLNPTAEALGPVRVRMLDVQGRVLQESSVSLAPGGGQQVGAKSLRGKARAVVITGGGAARAVLEVRGPAGAAALPFVSETGNTRVPAVYADSSGLGQ